MKITIASPESVPMYLNMYAQYLPFYHMSVKSNYKIAIHLLNSYISNCLFDIPLTQAYSENTYLIHS